MVPARRPRLWLPVRFRFNAAWRAPVFGRFGLSQLGTIQEICRVRFPVETNGRGFAMAMKRVIKGVHIVPMGFANAFLIEGDGGLTLVDAGFPGKEAAVFEAIRGR